MRPFGEWEPHADNSRFSSEQEAIVVQGVFEQKLPQDKDANLGLARNLTRGVGGKPCRKSPLEAAVNVGSGTNREVVLSSQHELLADCACDRQTCFCRKSAAHEIEIFFPTDAPNGGNPSPG
jgi:hypothetical protein